MSTMGPGPDAWRLARAITDRRMAAALSKAGLARLVGYTKAHVSRAENAVYGVPSAALIDAIGKSVGGLDELVALRQRALVERATVRRSQQDEAVHGKTEAALSTLDESLQKPEVALRIVSQRLASSNVSPVLLDELDDFVANLPRRYASEPHAALSRDVWKTWCQVILLLEGHQRLRDRAHLTDLAATLSCCVGRLALNLGQYPVARRFALVADQCADDLGHSTLRATAHLLMASVDFSRGDPAGTIRSLDKARRLVGEVNGWQVAHRARSLAVMGRQAEALSAVDDMAQLAEAVSSMPALPPFTVTVAQQWSAGVYVHLSAGERAEPLARDVLKHMESDPTAAHIDHDAALLDLALSLVLRKDPDFEHAASYGLVVLNQPEQRRSEALLRQARQLGGVLMRQSGLPVVQQYRDSLVGYSYPTHAILP